MTSGKKRERLLLVTAFAGFISLGLPDAVIGVAWPSVREAFGLAQSGLGAILVAAAGGVLVSSFFGGWLVQKMGVGLLLSVSSFLVTVSLFGYALSGAWGVFLVCAFVAGLGGGAIDTGLNTHAAHHFSTRHMNWLHACYGIGAMVGPLVMTGVLARGGPWRLGYAVLGVVLLLMATAFIRTRRQWEGAGDGAVAPALPVRLQAALRHPLVWLQAILFFLYTGFEVTAGQWSFTVLTEARAVDVDTAGIVVGGYWGCLAAGRVIFGFLVDRIGTDRLLRGAMLGVLLGAVLFAWPGSAPRNFAGLALAGLSLAPIFPCLMAQTPGRLGSGYAAHAVGLQVAAAVIGAAALPGLAGSLAQRLGLEAVGPVMIAAAVLLTVLHEALLGRVVLLGARRAGSAP